MATFFYRTADDRSVVPRYPARPTDNRKWDWFWADAEHVASFAGGQAYDMAKHQLMTINGSPAIIRDGIEIAANGQAVSTTIKGNWDEGGCITVVSQATTTPSSFPRLWESGTSDFYFRKDSGTNKWGCAADFLKFTDLALDFLLDGNTHVVSVNWPQNTDGTSPCQVWVDGQVVATTSGIQESIDFTTDLYILQDDDLNNGDFGGLAKAFYMLRGYRTNTEMLQLHDDIYGPIRKVRRTFVVVSAVVETTTVESGSFTLSGTDITLSENHLTSIDAGSFTLSGTAIGLLENYLTAIDSGSFTLTGTSIDLLENHLTPIDSGAFTLTGTAIDLLENHLTPIDSGAFTLTGTAIDLLEGHLTSIEAGSFILSGTDITLTAPGAEIITIESGSFTLTGTAIDLLENHLTSIEAGSYTLTGTVVGLLENHLTSIEAGTFTLSGTNIGLLEDHLTTIESGSYILTGTDVGLIKAISVSVDAGSFILSGTDIGLSQTSYITTIEPGIFTLTGRNIGLKAGIVLLETLSRDPKKGPYIEFLTDSVNANPDTDHVERWTQKLEKKAQIKSGQKLGDKFNKELARLKAAYGNYIDGIN